MTNVLGWDAAYCPNPIPTHYGTQPLEWCEVYIGGSSATRQHGWSAAELVRVEHMPKLPVWVPTPGWDNPRQSALACVAALAAFRVPAFATPWRAVLIDLETGAAKPPGADPSWLQHFQSVIVTRGYDTMAYASTSVVGAYPVYTGRIGACPDDDENLSKCYGKDVTVGLAGKQFAWLGAYDLDVLGSQVMPHLGLWGAVSASAEVTAEAAPSLADYSPEIVDG